MIPEKIENGMKLLDEKANELLEVEDWRLLINLEKLNLQLCTKCILGQLFGLYDDGLEILGLSPDWVLDEARQETTNLGFALPFGSGSEAYRQLTDQWKQALLEERKQ